MRDLSRLVFGVVTVLAAALAAPAMTAEAVPDPNTSREFSAKLLMCGQCHGLNGVPVRPGIPIIWGQEKNYIVKQMHDFRSKSRDVELMTWASITLHVEEYAPAADYFSKKAWPARSASAASTQTPRGIAVCQACHQADFRGAPLAEGAAAPRLAGQSYEYLLEAMRGYAEGVRKNNDTMMQLMAGISAADREAMARYLAGL